MQTAPTAILRDEVLASIDQRVVVRATFQDYLALDRARGEKAVPRLTYYRGWLEITSPSTDHEFIKKTLARIVEAYCDDLGVVINGFGSWTIKDEKSERGLEPDECYVLGEERHPERPDLAIEVVWSKRGMDKLEVYRGLRVREVWYWQDGRITVHELHRGKYRVASRSRVLPALDLTIIGELATFPSQSAAVRELRHRLKKRR